MESVRDLIKTIEEDPSVIDAMLKKSGADIDAIDETIELFRLHFDDRTMYKLGLIQGGMRLGV